LKKFIIPIINSEKIIQRLCRKKFKDKGELGDPVSMLQCQVEGHRTGDGLVRAPPLGGASVLGIFRQRRKPISYCSCSLTHPVPSILLSSPNPATQLPTNHEVGNT